MGLNATGEIDVGTRYEIMGICMGYGGCDGAMGAGVSSSGRAASSTSDSVDFTIMEGSSVSWRFVDDPLWLPFSKVSSHSVQDLHSLCLVLKQFSLTLCTSLIKVKGSFRIYNDTGDSRIMHMIMMMSLQKYEKETQQQVLQRPSEESERERASIVAWRPGDGGGSSPPAASRTALLALSMNRFLWFSGIERMIPWVMVVTANTCHQEAAETEQKHEHSHCNCISHGLHILELSKFSLQSPNNPYWIALLEGRVEARV